MLFFASLNQQSMNSSMRIMIADDDSGIIDAVEMLLDYHGYTVVSASENVLQKIRAEKPALLLLDIWMSGEDGIEVCRALKSDSQIGEMPIIMISASKDGEQSARIAGADDFLAKPFEMSELLEKIDKLLT